MATKQAKIKPTVGFIGQGFVGKNYADDFERRGYAVVRYALEEPYRANKEKIKECDVVLIGVPTPTVPAEASGEGGRHTVMFDDSIVRAAVGLVGAGKIAVIKSTVLPGTTADIQKRYPDRTVLYSPEFLSEATAAEDAAHPFSNIVGMAVDDAAHREAAERVLAILPDAPFKRVMSSTEAELVKYAHNGSGYVQIVFFNMMYDLAKKLGADWARVEAALQADMYICNRYGKPVHKSGRGAGGHCFIKDFAALRGLYEQTAGDAAGAAALVAFEEKNVQLLKASGKDQDLVKGVYGDSV